MSTIFGIHKYISMKIKKLIPKTIKIRYSFYRIIGKNSVFVWGTNCHSTLSSIMFQMRKLLLIKRKQELSEYKTMYMIKDYFSLLLQTIQKDTQELSKILLRLFNLLQHNGRKSHRYEKKTGFDILGVEYLYKKPAISVRAHEITVFLSLTFCIFCKTNFCYRLQIKK